MMVSQSFTLIILGQSIVGHGDDDGPFGVGECGVQLVWIELK
jgi:hypothetical protein